MDRSCQELEGLCHDHSQVIRSWSGLGQELVRRGVCFLAPFSICTLRFGCFVRQDNWADFAWGPDGRYISFVRCAALVFVSIVIATRDIPCPEWLAVDLAGLTATHVPRGSTAESCIASLRLTMVMGMIQCRLPHAVCAHFPRNHGRTCSVATASRTRSPRLVLY